MVVLSLLPPPLETNNVRVVAVDKCEENEYGMKADDGKMDPKKCSSTSSTDCCCCWRRRSLIIMVGTTILN